MFATLLQKKKKKKEGLYLLSMEQSRPFKFIAMALNFAA